MPSRVDREHRHWINNATQAYRPANLTGWTPERELHHQYDPTEAIEAAIDGESDEAPDIRQPFEHIDLGRFQRAVEQLPAMEQDLIHMRFTLLMRQEDIAIILCRSQAAISYRVERAIERLRYLISLPEFTEEELRADLGGVFGDIDIDIAVYLWRTGSQSEAARQLGFHQTRVAHRFGKFLRNLKAEAKLDPRLAKAALYFSSWRRGIGREVVHPHFQGRTEPPKPRRRKGGKIYSMFR